MKTSTFLTSLAPMVGREKCWYTVLCKLSNSVVMEIYCVTLTSSSQSSLSAITLHGHHTPRPSHSTAITLHGHHTPRPSHSTAITLHSHHTPRPSHSTAITLHRSNNKAVTMLSSSLALHVCPFQVVNLTVT